MGTYVPLIMASLNTGESDAQDMVSNRFDTVQAAASGFAQNALSLQSSLTGALSSLSIPDAPNPEITIPKPTEVSESTDLPPDIPDMPNSPNIGDITAPGITNILNPTYTAPTEPGIYSVSVPSDNFPSIPSPVNINAQTFSPLPTPIAPTAPNLKSIKVPAPPSLSFPNKPRLSKLSFPNSPSMTTVHFNGVAPNSSEIVVPGDLSYKMSVFEDNPVWTSMLNKLDGDLVDGATGLDSTVETAIYQRHKDRQQAENNKLYHETESMYGASGFNLPTGVMVSKLAELKAEIARKDDGVLLDIMIKQADLAQKNSHFAVEKAIQIGELLQNFFIQSEDLAFKIALETHNKAIEIYNAQVTFFNLKLDAYKTEASVYASLLQGETAKLEAYKAEISAIGVQSEAQKNEIEIYAKELIALDIQSKIYATQLESAKAEVSLEHLKVESYNILVQAYSEELKAEKNNVDVFKAKIEAENLKVAQYAEEVNAFRGAISAESERLKSLIDIERLKIDGSKLNVDKYLANIQAAIADIQAQSQVAASQAELSKTQSANYATLLNANAEISRMESANYSSKVQGVSQNYQNQTNKYLAEVKAKQDHNRTLIAEMSSNVQYAATMIDGYIKKMDTISKSYVAVKELQTKGTEGAMNASTQLAASAMNAVNATASYSYSGSASLNKSHSNNMSLSESHNFDE